MSKQKRKGSSISFGYKNGKPRYAELENISKDNFLSKQKINAMSKPAIPQPPDNEQLVVIQAGMDTWEGGKVCGVCTHLSAKEGKK